MRVFREPEGPDYGRDALTFAFGAVGGLALGLLFSRRAAPQRVGRFGADLRERARAAGERARSVASRLRPARLRRLADEQAELTQLEDAVLDAFLADGVLSERGIDIGAISPGIIELSGSVWTEDEADRAVDLAGSVAGVQTVVNRLDIEEELRSLERTRRRLEEEDEASGIRALQHGVARTGGMGSRRQARETEKHPSDDNHHLRYDALEGADKEQYKDEGISTGKPLTAERPEAQNAWRTRYREDEVENQDPHGKHAPVTLDEQPQDLNTNARVGEGMKPGVELNLEQADVPVKPDSNRRNESQEGQNS